MSHNIILRDVKFKDLAQLARVVEKVSNGQCVLLKDAQTFRTYTGQSNKCDAAIRMPGNYDIGLLKGSDGYAPVADFSMLYGNNPLQGERNPMGRVQQEYALQEAEYTAAQQGMSATRVNGANGTITLELVRAD